MTRFLFFLSVILCGRLGAQLSWTVSNTGISYLYTMTAFAAAPNGDLYVAGKGVNNALQWYPLLFKSTNGGVSWTSIDISSCPVKQPAALIFVGNKMIMGGNGFSSSHTVVSSNDFGATWAQAKTGLNTQYRVKDFALASGGELYVLMAQGNYNGLSKIYRTLDPGTGWTEVNIVDLWPFMEPSAIMFDQNGKMYLSGNDEINTMKRNLLFTSTNYGSNWLPSYSGIPPAATVNDLVRGKGSDLFAVCTETVGNASTKKFRIMKSTNAGVAWSTVTNVTGLDDLNECSYAFSHNGYMLLDGKVGSEPGHLYRSALVSLATVSTAPVSNIMDVSAVATGSILEDGALPVIKRGLCWSTGTSPTINQYNIESSGSPYTETLIGLQPGTKYYVRAFASNQLGISYGNEVTFTTLDFTGLAESAQRELRVFPSPVKEFLFIENDQGKAGQSVSIYNVLGSLVRKTELASDKSAINMQGLEAGCYMVEVPGFKPVKVIKE